MLGYCGCQQSSEFYHEAGVASPDKKSPLADRDAFIG
jgi:hypothetical protein